MKTALTLGATACMLGLIGCASEAESPDREILEEPTFAEIENPDEPGVVFEAEPTFYAEPRQVRIGFDGPQMDACGGYGEITGLNPDGDNYLSVRAAPATKGRELDRLTSGTGVSLCETAGSWLGVVYTAAGEAGGDCGTSSPVDAVQDYEGPCRSGWVNQRFVELIAG